MPYRALLIANWEYQDPDQTLGPLRGPENDLVAMEAALKHPAFGLFERVEAWPNLSTSDMGQTFWSFLRGAGTDDSLLIYFSGHGAQIGEGRLALCGVDTNNASLAPTSFDTNHLREWIGETRAPSTVVILDCCYAGGMKAGGPAESDIAAAFGTGTMVLSSGGLQNAKDAKHTGEPSPFTKALADILLNPELPGNDTGLLTVDQVYGQLLEQDPPLSPMPKINQRSQGSFPLARRERPARSRRDDLKLFRRPEQVEVIDLRFKKTCVRAMREADPPDELELTSFDSCRRSAVRRMSQLTDAILRVSEYDGDEWAQRVVRRAWNSVGNNLFETAVPPTVRDRIRAISERDSGTRLLKLRLTFDDEESTRLEAYPWEYLYREEDRSNDAEAPDLQPLALAPGLLLERVIRTEGPGTLESTLSGTSTIGVMSSLRGQFGEAAAKIADGLAAMADLNGVFDLRGPTATWGRFLDVVDQGPDVLMLFAPVARTAHGVQLGFWSKDPQKPDWQPVTRLIQELHLGDRRFRAIVFVTFAARPGRDSFRGTTELARSLAAAHLGPVVFVCHSPGYAKEVPEQGQDTLPLLFVDAFTRGERFDHAIYYAKNRAAGWGSQEAQRAFGVPGYYVIEPADADQPDARLSTQATGPRDQPVPSTRSAGHQPRTPRTSQASA